MTLAGCHSFHIDIAVENQTGVPIRLLEVDYPNASFGVDVLAANATYHYRIQVQGNGPLKVQYSTPVGDTPSQGQQRQIQGPVLTEKQEGTLKIVLLPNGKADFNPHLSAPETSSTGNP